MKKISENVFNPALMLGIGLFPLLIIADNLKSAVIFGVLILLALIISTLIYYAFKPIILENVRIPIYALITFSAVYILDSIVSELFIKNYNSVHALVAYIFVAVILMFMFETNKDKEKFGEGFKNTALLGIEYLVSLVMVGLVREILAFGTIWSEPIFIGYEGLEFFATTIGGLLVVAVYALIYNVVSGFIKSRRKITTTLAERYQMYLEENVKVEQNEEASMNNSNKEEK